MKRSMRNLRYVAMTLVLIMAFVVALVPMAVSAAPAAGVAEAPAYSGRYHVVRHGETLSHIARYYGVTIDAIKRANHLYGNTIYVGQHLYIPYAQSSHKTGCSRVHHVRYGETLSHIARYYGTTTAALASANGIYNPSHIYVGQRICIPNIYSSGYGYHDKSGYGKPSYDHYNKPSYDHYNKPSYDHYSKPSYDHYNKPSHGYHGKPSYGSCVYVVRRGDTLSEIAKWNGLSTRQLAYMNGIHNWSYIYVGQRLRVC